MRISSRTFSSPLPYNWTTNKTIVSIFFLSSLLLLLSGVSGQDAVPDVTVEADFASLNNGRSPGALTEYKGNLYFALSDDVNGRELWVYNPNTETASLFLDINPGVDESSPDYFLVFDDLLYFATTGFNFADRGLWSTDGTVQGTQLVQAGNILTTIDSFPLIVIDDSLYFVTDTELYRVRTRSFSSSMSPTVAPTLSPTKQPSMEPDEVDPDLSRACPCSIFDFVCIVSRRCG